MTTEPGTYLSDMRPRFDPFVIDCGKIPAYSYQGSLRSELASNSLTSAEAIAILEDMLVIREFEEMIVKLRSGAYDPIRDYNYRGPTHVSVGQEGTAAGACAALRIADNITSTHRGHGESLAKGTVALRAMSEEALRARVPDCRANSREELIEAALEQHVYRTIGELFGKDEGYCRGRGGSMHIADFTVGHLGANAIVGGGVPIATGAAMASRYFADDGVVCCFAGDGAYANGVVLEVAELRRPGPVHQPLRQWARLRPADRLSGLQQPLRHDRSRRRRSVGREPPGAARGGLRRQPDARRGRQRHERPGGARRGVARREALPRRQGAGADRGRLLSLLGPFVERSAQRISHQGRGSGLEGGRPDREPTRRN